MRFVPDKPHIPSLARGEESPEDYVRSVADLRVKSGWALVRIYATPDDFEGMRERTGARLDRSWSSPSFHITTRAGCIRVVREWGPS